MTKSQQAAVELIRRSIERQCEEQNEEIKEFDVRHHDEFVSVYIVHGRRNDDGNMNFWFRTYRHIFIGRKGGLQLLNPGKWIKDENKRSVKAMSKRKVTGRKALWATTF